MCPQPVATAAWRWVDVAERQHGRVLASRTLGDGQWVDDRRGMLAGIRPLQSLRDGFCAREGGDDGRFMTCGTFGALPNARGEGVRPATRMELALHAPVLGRSIVHRCAVDVLPIVA